MYVAAGVPDNNPHYALSSGDVLLALAANALSIILILVLENSRGLRRSASKIILYDRIDLIVPERRDELFKDIEERCGITPVDVTIGNIDFLKDSAYIKIYYNTESCADTTLDSIIRDKQLIDNQTL